MSERERMLSGELYYSPDQELTQMHIKCHEILDEFNQTKFNDFRTREILAHKLFKSVGENCFINKPFYCDYGVNITVGNNFYANFNCIILDVNEVIIGDNVMFAPNVNIYTATHPIDKNVRNLYLEYGKKIIIGNDVWIGGNVVINPGVTIGDGTIIGSGSVVTKSMPSGVVAAGNPCKIIRKITDEDKGYWQQKKEEYYTKKKEEALD